MAALGRLVVVVEPAPDVPGQWVASELVGGLCTQGDSPIHALEMMADAMRAVAEWAKSEAKLDDGLADQLPSWADVVDRLPADDVVRRGSGVIEGDIPPWTITSATTYDSRASVVVPGSERDLEVVRVDEDGAVVFGVRPSRCVATIDIEVPTSEAAS